MATNFYDILEVPRTASDKEVQSAFRRLARRYHPDLTGGDAAAEQRFKQVNAAHDVLGDRTRRAAYDKWGDRWEHAEQLEEMQHSGGSPFGARRRAGGGPRGGGFNDPGGIRFDFSPAALTSVHSSNSLRGTSAISSAACSADADLSRRPRDATSSTPSRSACAKPSAAPRARSRCPERQAHQARQAPPTGHASPASR